jgi:hypothetical protein
MTAPGTQGEVSPESIGENSRRAPARRETCLSPHYWEPGGTKSTKTLPRKPFQLWKELKFESQKGNSR